MSEAVLGLMLRVDTNRNETSWAVLMYFQSQIEPFAHVRLLPSWTVILQEEVFL